VALTLLVLDIKLPENIAYPTDAALWLRLISLERHFVIYPISFAVIAMYWIGHHIQFHFVRYTDRRLIWINFLYMLLISFVPFASMLIAFYSTHASIYVYVPLALSHFFRGRIDEHIHTTPVITAGLNEQ